MFIKNGCVYVLEDTRVQPYIEHLRRRGFEVTVQRASHIEPCRLGRRILFRLLRRLFGEDGRVGEWTRRWHCDWRVDLRPVGGPIRGPFFSRRDALHYELSIVECYLQRQASQGRK